MDPETQSLVSTRYNPFIVQSPLVIIIHCGPGYDSGKKPLSSPLPRPRGTITDKGHLVQDLVVFSSFVGSNGLAVIRDVEDPEPAIEAEFSVTGIGPNKMDLSRLEVLGN